MQVSYHNRHAETVWKAWSLYTNLLFSCSKFYSVFMTSQPGGVTLSTVQGDQRWSATEFTIPP